MTSIYESDVEQLAVELLERQGWFYLSPEAQEFERQDFSDVVLGTRLQAAIDKLNPAIPNEIREQARRRALTLTAQNPVASNELFHEMLREGVTEDRQKDGETVGVKVRLIDFDTPLNNDFVVCNQFTVTENKPLSGHGTGVTKRPDIILFVNGLPMVVIELKNPVDENATPRKAFDQLQTYKETISSLFCYNGVLVASDGLDAKAGSLTAGWSRFMAWKTVDGKREDPNTTPQLLTLIKGMLRPDVLLELVRHFSVFEKVKQEDPASGQISIETIKKVAAYHQYHAVKEAVKSTIRASSGENVEEDPGVYNLPGVKGQPRGDRKAGVVWHTQGSGKSLSMVFYAGLLVVHREMNNPTIVVITDRNDLDDQLFDAFVAGKELLRQVPKQAESRAQLKQLLQTAGGGIVFSTIQKFLPEDGSENFQLLSNRHNIIVIADEAHRSQYGFGARTHFVKDGAKTNYGFAKYLRDALPEATFIGFTGTPIEKEDASTPAVFGNYIDVYDIEQAVEDGATVPVYYESRLVQVHLKEEEKAELDAEVEGITESEEATATEKAKVKWSKQEAIIGHEERVKSVVTDILKHFDARQEVFAGKAMIVATSRRIAVAMHDEIVALRPDWHDEDKNKGQVKVIMTSSSSDPATWQRHSTSKTERKTLRERFQDPDDPLQIVIVRDMWLTGFDAPCLTTMYLDKIMRGHSLMQAIARVNRVYKDKPGGRVVDYIGIASDLKQALVSYTQSNGRGAPAFEQEQAVEKMLEKHAVVAAMFDRFAYKTYFSADTQAKLGLILEAEEHVLGLENGKERFIREVGLLEKAFALSVPDPRAMAIKAEVGFFQAVKARLKKFERQGSGKSLDEVETAIRQIVDKAVVVEGVLDIFEAAGIKKPDISILSDDFLQEIQGMKRKNLALELLKKILNDELRTRRRKNLAQGKRFSEMLEAAIRKYRNNLLTTAQVIEELIQLAKEIKVSDDKVADMGLSDDEVAFYDTLILNESAKEVMGDDTLRSLAQVLVQRVKQNISIDWTIKESARAKLRTTVRRLLREYGYPPDQQKLATENILRQTELLADEWSTGTT